MDIPTIHVHTQSDKATVGYATFMWETMRLLANHPEALKLSVHGIGPTAGDRLAALPACKTYQVPNVNVDQGMVGSTAHGACIEHALGMTDDGDIHILCDSDTVVVAKGWDDYVRTKLLDDGLGIIGTAVEDLGGFSSGGGNVQMAKNLPTVAWCALSPGFSWRALKALPSKGADLPINTDVLSKTYNLPLGYSVLRDVAWQIPQYLADHKIPYQAWKQLKPSTTATILKGLSDYHEEYHVEEIIPFVVHQRGSMRHAYRTDRISSAFYGAVDRFLAPEKEFGRPAHWKWGHSEKSTAVLAKAKEFKEAAATRLTDLERMIKAGDTGGALTGTGVAVAAATSSTIGGWLKASLDGASVWGRGKVPVPSLVEIGFIPDSTFKNLRLEGTVTNVQISLPPAYPRPHTLIVRNLTAGNVMLRTEGNGKIVNVPQDACWFVVVDVDGVIHVT